ncbi:MAG: peptidase associated/transthyretin-like domain-containing protein [Bellilinea sp.]
MRKIQTFSILLIFILLSSCTQLSKTKISDNLITDPIDDFKVPERIPQPLVGKGSVIGQIYSKKPQDIRGSIVYLGELVVLPDNMYGSFLNTDNAPSSLIAVTDGKFYIHDVRPGLYSLIIYEVMMGGKVYQNTTGSAIPIEVVADRITDVGVVDFPLNE